MAFERICTMTKSRIEALDKAISGLDDSELYIIKKFMDRRFTSLDYMIKKSGIVDTFAMLSDDSNELFSEINIFEGMVVETTELLAYMEVMEVIEVA